MNLPDTQFGVQSFWRKMPRPVAEDVPHCDHVIPCQPALASAQDSRYVEGFVVSFSLQVSRRVGVTAPAFVDRAPPMVISGPANRTAPRTAVARDKFFFIISFVQ